MLTTPDHFSLAPLAAKHRKSVLVVDDTGDPAPDRLRLLDLTVVLVLVRP
jgi:hypothetical protein